MMRTIDLNYMLSEVAEAVDTDLYSLLKELGVNDLINQDNYEAISNFKFNLTDTDFSLRIEE